METKVITKKLDMQEVAIYCGWCGEHCSEIYTFNTYGEIEKTTQMFCPNGFLCCSRHCAMKLFFQEADISTHDYEG